METHTVVIGGDGTTKEDFERMISRESVTTSETTITKTMVSIDSNKRFRQDRGLQSSTSVISNGSYFKCANHFWSFVLGSELPSVKSCS